MRTLLWFTIGFCAACALAVYLITGLWLLPVLAVIAAGLFLCIRFLPNKYRKKAACLLLGFVVGFLWVWFFDCLYLRPVRSLDGAEESLAIEITDYSDITDYGIRAIGKTELAGRRYTVQFYMNEQLNLSPGDQVEGKFELRYTGIGAQRPTYHGGKGVFLLAYCKDDGTVTYTTGRHVKYFSQILRHSILEILDAVFPEDVKAFASALLLGQTQQLSYGTRTALKLSGIYHVVAVSGMHISILFTLISILCDKRRVLMAAVGIPMLFLFAAVAGFTPSVLRACIMQSLMILAMLVDKEYDSPNALATAVLILLAINPLSISSVSLQLSVGCIVGILMFSQKIHDYFLRETSLGPAKGVSFRARVTRWVVGSLSVSLGAMIFTVPLSAIYFGTVSVMGVVSNLLILWLISIVFYGVVASCVLGAIWVGFGGIIGWVIAWPIRIIIWVSNMLSNISISSVFTSSIYIVAWLLFSYVMIVIFRRSKKKHPAVLAGCLLISLIVAVTFSWVEPRMENFRVTAVDVGQGQCVILHSNGKYYMVDCGGDSGDAAADAAAQELASQGIFHLDGLIITHYDYDHAGGAMQLMERVKTDKVYLPIYDGDNDIRDEIVKRYSDRIYWVNVEETILLPNGSMTIYPSIDTDSANDCSLCVLFQPKNCDILITGDRSESGERELMEQTDLPDLEILFAGHHGSRTSTSMQLLYETRPEVVIISVGADNSYGHPTWETLERLELFECEVYRTDLEGTIIFRG